MNIEYVAPIKDVSGYAASARNYILALLGCGHNVNVIEHDFSKYVVEFSEKENEIKRHIGKHGFKPDVRIFHMPVDAIHYSISKWHDRVPAVGLFFWEVDGVPDTWVEWLNECYGILLPCEKQKSIIQRQGVKVPCYTVGQAMDVDFWSPTEPDKTDSAFNFYSVFQWTERKNPRALLHAYFSEFTAKDNVLLTIKSYLGDHSEQQAEMIRQMIRTIRNEIPNYDPSSNPGYPKVLLVPEMNTAEQMKKLYANCDCFISTHRGEGFGMPIVEAMSMERPVIATQYYAPEDYLTHENSYPISYIERPVFAVAGYHWYSCRQKWAEANVMEIKAAMRDAYKNTDAAMLKGKAARETIVNKYSPSVVGDNIAAAIQKIIEAR